MRQENKPPDKSPVIEYLTLSLAATVGGILMLLAARGDGYGSRVMSNLGEALVIAALVGIFVELRLVKRATEQMVAAGKEATDEMVAAGTKAVEDLHSIMGGGLRQYISAEKFDALQKAVLYPLAFARVWIS
jgi:hypothetical protein